MRQTPRVIPRQAALVCHSMVFALSLSARLSMVPCCRCRLPVTLLFFTFYSIAASLHEDRGGLRFCCQFCSLLLVATGVRTGYATLRLRLVVSERVLWMQHVMRYSGAAGGEIRGLYLYSAAVRRRDATWYNICPGRVGVLGGEYRATSGGGARLLASLG